jgi:hypothetical protein
MVFTSNELNRRRHSTPATLPALRQIAAWRGIAIG